jgi:pyoverdine/dityrosine biosynthesis protein Dit1
LRDIQINRAQANDQRLSEALTLATGMAQDQADTMIAALGEGTNRQKALSDIALGVLDRNMIWNQFLANYGLDRDRLLNEIQQGNIDQLLPIFQLFMQFASLSRGGTI